MVELTARQTRFRARLDRYEWDCNVWKTLIELGATSRNVPDLNGLRRVGLVTYRAPHDCDPTFPSEWALTDAGMALLEVGREALWQAREQEASVGDADDQSL